MPSQIAVEWVTKTDQKAEYVARILVCAISSAGTDSSCLLLSLELGGGSRWVLKGEASRGFNDTCVASGMTVR